MESQKNDQLQAILAALQAQGAVASGWSVQPQLEGLTGISIPVKRETPVGSVRIYLHFGADFFEPAKLDALLEKINSVVGLDAWQKKNTWQGGGGYNRGGSGGSYGSGGGYNRGGWR